MDETQQRLDADLEQARELNLLLAPLKMRAKRKAAGALAYDYLCPGGPYDEQWDWDGFFIGVALATADPREAIYLRNWCLNFLLNADEDGFTPGVITPQGRDQRLNQMKPFLAQGAYLASRFLGDFEWVTPHLERLMQVVTYRERHLWDATRGLALWHDAMESGADNNVAFPTSAPGTPAPVDRVAGADVNTFVYRDYLAMGLLLRSLGREAEAREYHARAQALAAAMNRYLWSEEAQCYYNLDTATGRLIKRMTYSNFVPLWGRVASEEQGRAQILAHLLNPDEMWAAYGGRSLAANDLGYNNVNMIKPYSNWQGPVWPIANYLYLHGLLHYGFRTQALELAGKITRLCLRDVRASGAMHENYHADTGEPLAAPGFVGWNLLAGNMMDEALSGRDPFEIVW
jgi:alpha,alpha-trehalase